MARELWNNIQNNTICVLMLLYLITSCLSYFKFIEIKKIKYDMDLPKFYSCNIIICARVLLPFTQTIIVYRNCKIDLFGNIQFLSKTYRVDNLRILLPDT